MSGTDSDIGEFNAGIGGRQCGNALAQFFGYIQVIGSNNNKIWCSNYDCNNGYSEAYITNPHSWGATQQLVIGQSFAPETADMPAAVVLWLGGTSVASASQTLLFFWNQTDGGMMGVVADGTDTSGWPNWGNGYVLCDSNGNTLTPTGNHRQSGGLNGSDISAASIGLQKALVAFPILYPSDSNQSAIYLGTYSLAGQTTESVTTNAGTFSKWNADGSVIIPVDQLAQWGGVNQQPGVQIKDTGNTASVVVLPSVTQAGDGGNATPALNAQCFLTVYMTQTGVDHWFWWPMSFIVPLDANGVAQPDGIAGQPKPQNMWIAGWLPKSNVVAITDPSGQVATAYSSFQSGQSWRQPAWLKGNSADYVFLDTMGTATLPAGAGGAGNQIYPQPTNNANNMNPPALLCVFDTANTSTDSGTDATSGQPTTTTTIPILLLVVYGGQYMQLLNWGTAQSIEFANPVTLTAPPGAGAQFPVGIFDTPAPMPAANINGWQFESTTNDLMPIIYGYNYQSTSTTENYFDAGGTFNYSMTVGTVEGIPDEEDLQSGFTFSTAIKAGGGKDWSNTTQQIAGESASLTSLADVDSGSMKGLGAQNQGSVFLTGVAGMSLTNFAFTARNGTTISNGSLSATDYTASAMIQASVAPVLDPSAATATSFVAYMVDPGDLLSYTPERIDSRMAQLTGKENYFEKIIYPSAQSLMDATGKQQPYMLFSWSNGRTTGGTYQFISGSTTTKSWNLSASVSAGWTWGMDGGIPLVSSVEWQGSWSVGAYGDGGMKWTTSNQSQWGITPPTTWGPPYWGSPDDPAVVAQNDLVNPNWFQEVVAAYTFALFYLPDPTPGNPANLPAGYWVQELLKCANVNAAPNGPYLDTGSIDPGAGCWRVVCVVTKVQTYADLAKNPPTYTYQYSDPNHWFS